MRVTAPLQEHVTNPLPEVTSGYVTGIIGERPSQYAKSPTIWNQTFRALGIEAVYLPYDVEGAGLPGLVEALRQHERYLGGSVTLPYKLAIMDLLDEVDPMARQIGAVNTIVRTPGGKLIGYNTDGQGAIDALTRLQPAQRTPFVHSLDGQRVLLIGAGGAARAVAFSLGQCLGPGKLWIANRRVERATELVGRVRATGALAEALPLNELAGIIGEVTLVVNASSVGQSGLHSLPDGGHAILEPYSPLVPFRTEPVAGVESEAIRAWAATAFEGIARNTRQSWELMIRLPTTARCFDLIYSPPETVFLQQARLSGHPTTNGKAMNICQAVVGFMKVMRPWLADTPGGEGDFYAQVQSEMYRVW